MALVSGCFCAGIHPPGQRLGLHLDKTSQLKRLRSLCRWTRRRLVSCGAARKTEAREAEPEKHFSNLWEQLRLMGWHLLTHSGDGDPEAQALRMVSVGSAQSPYSDQLCRAWSRVALLLAFLRLLYP